MIGFINVMRVLSESYTICPNHDISNNQWEHLHMIDGKTNIIIVVHDKEYLQMGIKLIK